MHKFHTYILVLIILLTACKVNNEGESSNQLSSEKVNQTIPKKPSKKINKKPSNNLKMVEVLRDDYTLKYPKFCKVENRPSDGTEIIIYGPKTNKNNAVKLFLRKIKLKKSLKESINQFIENDKKQFKGFKLINKMPDGYRYSKQHKNESVSVYHKVRINNDYAYIFTYEAEEEDFERYKKTALKVFNSLTFRNN